MAVLLCATLLPSAYAQAEDLGAVGPVYAIEEPDLLQHVLDRLRAAEASGELAALQDAARQRTEAAIASPPPVAGISRATGARSFHFDPSIVVKDPIYAPDGTLVVPPGTKVNPLDHVALTAPLLFIDARDEAQLGTANTQLAAHQGRLKLILTGGSWQSLTKRLKRPVFYDQQGSLTRRLGIRNVPALVTQDGRTLRIDEGF